MPFFFKAGCYRIFHFKTTRTSITLKPLQIGCASPREVDAKFRHTHHRPFSAKADISQTAKTAKAPASAPSPLWAASPSVLRTAFASASGVGTSPSHFDH